MSARKRFEPGFSLLERLHSFLMHLQLATTTIEEETPILHNIFRSSRARLKCDGTRAETTFLLSAQRTSPFKLAGASVQSTTGSRCVRISCSNAGYTMFRGSVKGTGYPLHSSVSPSLPLPCVTVCHNILTGVYVGRWCWRVGC